MVFHTFYPKKSMDIDCNRSGCLQNLFSHLYAPVPSSSTAALLSPRRELGCSTAINILHYLGHFEFNFLMVPLAPQGTTGSTQEQCLGRWKDSLTHLYRGWHSSAGNWIYAISNFSYIHWSVQFCGSATSVIFLGHSQRCIPWSQKHLISHKNICFILSLSCSSCFINILAHSAVGHFD